MTYLYHFVPKNMAGTILYPLNELKDVQPEIYKEQFSKYVGREHITRQTIPYLNCLWNDVLHLSAVHPHEIKSALSEAGENTDFKRVSYQIDPRLLDPKNTLVYLYLYKDRMREENWAVYDPEDLEKYSLVPQATKDYYKETLQKGEKPFLYHGVPHILYKGSLDIADIPKISV